MRLASTATLKASQSLRGLYAITDSDLIAQGHLVERVTHAIQGGASVIQYRDSGTDSARREHEVRALLPVCRASQIPLIINNDVALAHSTGADGVHLGGHDMSVMAARALLGPHAIIGASCYNSVELALLAADNGADYVAFGSFFLSQTKPEAVPADISLLTEASKQLAIPIVAIGGITPALAPQLIQAGADMVAVIHGVFGQPDARIAAQHFAHLFAAQSQLHGSSTTHN